MLHPYNAVVYSISNFILFYFDEEILFPINSENSRESIHPFLEFSLVLKYIWHFQCVYPNKFYKFTEN